MEFEYDPAESRANRAKHEIDFEQAQALWSDPRPAEAPARPEGEPRWLMIGQLEGHLWTAVFTRRGERIRIISVRRSHGKEIAAYEDEEDDDR